MLTRRQECFRKAVLLVLRCFWNGLETELLEYLDQCKLKFFGASQ